MEHRPGVHPLLVRSSVNILHAAGFHRLMAARASSRGAVLCLHRVRPDPPGDFAPNAHLEITPDFLAAIVARARALGMDMVDLDEAKRRLADASARRFFVVTIDDGYRDSFRVALPALKELDCPFTVFIATGFIDRIADAWWIALEEVIARQDSVAVNRGGATEIFSCRTLAAKRATFKTLHDWLWTMEAESQRSVMRDLAWRYGVDNDAIVEAEMMDWGEVKQLAADPLVTIGAHTVGHCSLAGLPPARARAEMVNSAKVLEAAIGKRPRHFSYPYGSAGDAGEREFRMAAELGFEIAVTTRRGLLTRADLDRPTAWPRVVIDGRRQSLRYLDIVLSGAAYAFDRFRSVRGVAST